jgi:hypothetical protein
VGPSEAEVQDTPASAKLRFITRVKELVPLAQTRLAEAQAQYKKNFDGSIKEKNKEVLSGSWVYLRREVHEAGQNPKLDDQVDGPYQVIATDGRVFKFRIGDDDVPVSSDPLTPAPVSDPAPRNREDPIDETARPVAAGDDDDEEEGYEGSPTDEFVFERITGMKSLMTELFATRFAGMDTGPRTTPGNPVLTYPPHPYADTIAGQGGLLRSNGILF